MILKTSNKKIISNIEKIECDKCHIIYKDSMEIQEFLIIDFIGGYKSIFGDGNHIKADICQYCLQKMLNGIYIIEKENNDDE